MQPRQVSNPRPPTTLPARLPGMADSQYASPTVGPTTAVEQAPAEDQQGRARRATSGGSSHPRDGAGAPRRANTIREEFLTRPRQLVTAQPRLVSAAILDSRWTHTLLQDPEYILLNVQRWCCVRCTLLQQAAAVSAAQRLSMWKREDLISPAGVANTQDVLHDLTLNGSTDGETFCCGWNVNPPTAAAHGFESTTAHHGNALPMRACGCEWTPASALGCMLLTDALTLGCPCAPVGYMGCGTLVCGMQTRWLIRKKYRIIGFGVSDFCTMLCCPQCAVEQQSKELSRQGVVVLEAPGPCSMDQ